MLYLNNYTLYNEKINWRNVIIYSVLFFSLGKELHSKRNDLTLVNNLYNEINSKKSIPSSEESEFLEKIRQELIVEISNSSRWNKFGKDSIIDSIRTIKFRIVDYNSYLSNVSYNSIACFIDIKRIKNNTSFFIKYFTNDPKEDNMIVIRKDALYKEDFKNILIHELYHYFDKLLIDNIGDYSQHIDEHIKNKKYASNKYSILVRNSILNNYKKSDIDSFTLIDVNGNRVNIYNIASNIVDSYLDNYNYYTSNDEIFARWWSLKSDMISLGIISNFDKKVELKDIRLYLTKCSDSNASTCYDIMMFLDWEKLDEFQEII